MSNLRCGARDSKLRRLKETAMRVLSQRDLPSKGIHWSREHTRRMWQAGKFPRPFKLDDEGGWNYWTEEEIDEWLQGRAKRGRVRGTTGADATLA
jgi:predicted DNA-binding transcriptional regulator AlpA